MALEKMTGLPGLGSDNSLGIGKIGGGGVSSTNQPGSAKGIDFKNALDQALQPAGTPAAGKGIAGSGATSGANETLSRIRASMPNEAVSASSLKFSNHSIERMHSRGITYSPEQMKSIENAVAKAAAKGSKDTLVLTDNSALIVSVKNGTVVTVMDRQTMKENVFTNIDSTVMA